MSEKVKMACNCILENKVQNSSRRLSSSSCSRAIFFKKNYFRVCPFSMLMFQYYCVKDQWRTFSIKRCPFPLFLPNVSFCCQDEKDINGLLEECRCGGKYQYIIQRTEREREREIDTKGPVFIRSSYNSFFIFEKLSEILWQPGCPVTKMMRLYNAVSNSQQNADEGKQGRSTKFLHKEVVYWIKQ